MLSLSVEEKAIAVSTRAGTYTNGPILGSTRTALLRSLTRMLEEPSPDWSTSYEEQLKGVDLKLARADRARRALARERLQMERALCELRGMMEVTLNPVRQQLSVERDDLIEKLDEVDLSIAQLDRKRRHLRKERKRLEALWGEAGAAMGF